MQKQDFNTYLKSNILIKLPENFLEICFTNILTMVSHAARATIVYSRGLCKLACWPNVAHVACFVKKFVNSWYRNKPLPSVLPHPTKQNVKKNKNKKSQNHTERRTSERVTFQQKEESPPGFLQL